MRLQALLLLALTALQASLGIAASLMDMPQCGLICTARIVPDYCSLTDEACICTNTVLHSKLTACVTDSCSIRDSLTMQKISVTTCHLPTEDNSIQIAVITPVFGVLAVLFFLLRVLARYLKGMKATWGYDDWAMVPTVIATIPMTCLSFILTKHGLGKDIWMVPFDDIEAILYIYFWDEILYLFIVPATKVSIICFYLRIFPRRKIRRWSYALIIANILYLITFEVVTIFQCTPIDGAWLHWDGEDNSTCRNISMQAFGAAIAGIVLDVATILLPLPELWKLNLSMKKKLQVMFMFSTGLFVTVVSALRLQSLIAFSLQNNITQDFVTIGVWSTVETGVGIMCACMPAVRTLFSLFAPKVFGSTERTDNRTGGTHGTPGTDSSRPFKIKCDIRSKDGDESSFVELMPVGTSDAFERGDRFESGDQSLDIGRVDDVTHGRTNYSIPNFSV